jgi:CheY-like chemotaxis protein/HD-like signal output (HDOD) protein
MANILLIDDSDVAGRSMRGLLSRADHRCEVATTPDEAWKIIREAVVIDIVFLELNIAENAGLNFLQQLRDGCFWKLLPVVVYTTVSDPVRVRKALSLKVQNYLIKPYAVAVVTAEINKAVAKGWRNLHFVDAATFCAQVGVTADALAKLRKGLMGGLEECAKVFPDLVAQRDVAAITHRLSKLSLAAEKAGVWAVADFVHEAALQVTEGRWAGLKTAAENLDFVRRLVFCQMNPHHLPAALRTPLERGDTDEEMERLIWLQADIETLGPIIPKEEIERQVASLAGCPVAESVATTFRKLTESIEKKPTEITELAASDSGLCAQIIEASNRSTREAIWAVDDPETGIRLLGDIQLSLLAKKLPQIKERYFDTPPVTWPAYAAFQLSVARTAYYICDYMGFAHLLSLAHTAGLLQDIGKLLLARIQPNAFNAIVRFAREKKIPLAEAERQFIGCTTREMAEWYARSSNFPEAYIEVIRCVETPELATAHAELVAVVSLARHMCIYTRVGQCGEIPADPRPLFSTLPAWPILEPRIFSGFSARQFEAQTHAFCVRLKHDLLAPNTSRRL